MDINIDNYLRINPVDMAMVLVSTFLIVVIVRKYFWHYAKDYLAARQEHVKQELDTSSKNLRESEALKAKYEAQMQEARLEAGEIVSSAKVKAVKEAHEIISGAKHNASLVKERAFQDIEFEKAKVKDQMKEEISEVAFLAAKKVVGKELDESVHKKYVKDFIDKAKEDETWQA